MNSIRLHRIIGSSLITLAVLVIVYYICTFKIVDNDFWWHVKAGEIMWKTGSLIHTEPFSYVLAGQPYTSSHEWLAQIVFYLVFHLGGVTASILLRGTLIAGAALLLLGIDRRSLHWSAPLVIIAMYVYRPAFMVRPQLFSVLLFCLLLLLVFQYVQRIEKNQITRRLHWIFGISIVCIQLLWVNLHGAVAIFGDVILTGFFLQGWLDWYLADASERMHTQKELWFRGILLAVAAVELLASPDFFYTFIDLYQHRFDRTIPLVREWMPMSVSNYLIQVIPFFLIAATSLLLRRRAWLLCTVLLAVTGMLSLEAYRHCILFVLSCVGVTIFQFSAYEPWRRMQDRALSYPLATAGMTLLLLGGIWLSFWHHDANIVFRTNEFGFGVEIPVTGAVDFVRKEGITGTLFNTYNQGGYILYRCSPQCLVFADGRNLQYGYPFLQKLMDAATNPVRWKELDDQYHFTYAIVEYKATADYGDLLPYIANFAADPSWIPVYLDDSAAVYVRNLPQNAAVIQRDVYKILTPKALEFTDALDALPENQWPLAEAELLRSIREDPTSVKARLLLGNRYLAQHRLKDAEAMAQDAVRAEPYLPEIYELLGRISVENQEWAQAGAYLERAVQLTNGVGQSINYDYLAMVFSRAGENDKAEIYHRKAVRAGQQSPVRE